MEKMLKLGVLSALLVGMLFSSFVLAGADGALVNNIGGSQTGIDTPDIDSGGTQAVAAGTVYHLNLDADSSTNYWAGVWGNVSGSIQLREVNGAVFLQKDVLTPRANPPQGVYSVVFAYNVADTVPNFGALNANLLTGAQVDARTGVGTSLTDSASNVFNFNLNTFNGQNSLVIGSKLINVNAANTAWCGRAHNATSGLFEAADCQYANLALNDSTNNLLFASQVVNPFGPTNWKIFDNATFAHYQMLLYVNNSGTANTQNYEFFLELR